MSNHRSAAGPSHIFPGGGASSEAEPSSPRPVKSAGAKKAKAEDPKKMVGAKKPAKTKK